MATGRSEEWSASKEGKRAGNAITAGCAPRQAASIANQELVGLGAALPLAGDVLGLEVLEHPVVAPFPSQT